MGDNKVVRFTSNVEFDCSETLLTAAVMGGRGEGLSKRVGVHWAPDLTIALIPSSVPGRYLIHVHSERIETQYRNVHPLSMIWGRGWSTLLLLIRRNTGNYQGSQTGLRGVEVLRTSRVVHNAFQGLSVRFGALETP